MQVHRARVHRGAGRSGVDGAEQATGVSLHHRHWVPTRAPDVHSGMRALTRSGPEPATGPAPQQPFGDQIVDHGPGHVTTERIDAGVGQWQLGGRAGQLRAQHVGIRRIQHRGLDRRAE